MKRVLIAGVLGGLLLLGTPTLAASAEKEGRRFEKSSDHKGDRDKGGRDKGDRDKGDRDKGDRDKGDRGERARRGDDDRGDRDGRHRRYRHHRHYHGGYYRDPYYGGYYGDPYDPYGPGYNYPRRQGQVVVRAMRFNPPEVHSRAGDPVLWLFQDGDIPHTVTANNGSFDSGTKVNDEYQLRFHHPGTYSYHCAIHPEMTGKVIIH